MGGDGGEWVSRLIVVDSWIDGWMERVEGWMDGGEVDG